MSKDKKVVNVQSPQLPVSWGEVIDKITILEIKSNRITKRDALENVRRELELILSVADVQLTSNIELANLKIQLSKINADLWDIEDKIREKENLKEFDDEFIQLARSVYLKNDGRARLKKTINLLLHSDIIEEKSYKQY